MSAAAYHTQLAVGKSDPRQMSLLVRLLEASPSGHLSLLGYQEAMPVFAGGDDRRRVVISLHVSNVAWFSNRVIC